MADLAEVVRSQHPLLHRSQLHHPGHGAAQHPSGLVRAALPRQLQLPLHGGLRAGDARQGVLR